MAGYLKGTHKNLLFIKGSIENGCLSIETNENGGLFKWDQ